MNPTPTNDEREGLPSASGADKWYNCPGSVAAESVFPKSESSQIADQGTAIHLALQVGETEGLELDEATIVERLDAIKKAAVEDWHVAFGLNPANTQVGKEERYWIYDASGDNKIASAKLDAFFINGNRAALIDYKSGFLHATPAARNAQLKIQALCLWGAWENLEHIRVAIAQCRFAAHYDPCDYTLNDLQNARAELTLMDWRSRQPDAPRYAGTWCRYCRANGACKEAAAYSMMPLSIVSKTETFDKAAVLDRVSRMELPELAFVRERAALTRTILDAVSDRIKTYDNAALATVGLELGEPGKTRKVRDFQALFSTLFNEGLVTLEEFSQWVSVKLGDMDSFCIKKLAEKNSITQKAAKPILATLTEPHITFTPSEPRIKQLKD